MGGNSGPRTLSAKNVGRGAVRVLHRVVVAVLCLWPENSERSAAGLTTVEGIFNIATQLKSFARTVSTSLSYPSLFGCRTSSLTQAPAASGCSAGGPSEDAYRKYAHDHEGTSRAERDCLPTSKKLACSNVIRWMAAPGRRDRIVRGGPNKFGRR